MLRKFYQGKLEKGDAKQALEELKTIRSELNKLSLENYFVTSTGRDLIDLLKECFEELRDNVGTLKIKILSY